MVVETTSTVRAREDLVLINKELGHRLKNTSALVQSIAVQTLQGITEREAIAALQERIAALGRAHEVLLQQEWSAVSLAQAIRETLEPVDGLGQIRTDGPDLTIGSATTMTLSLILHELATNASKYGALSVPSGSVALTWRVEDQGLHLSWQESGDRPSKPPHISGSARA